MSNYDYNDTEKFITDTLCDCKEMLKYIYSEDKWYKKQLKQYKKDIKTMKEQCDQEGIIGLIER